MSQMASIYQICKMTNILLPKAEKCWNTVTPQEHWQAWLDRDKRSEEEVMVCNLAGNPDVVVDIGCGSGRYAHCLKYKSYYGFDTWDKTVDYATDWVLRDGLPNCVFGVGGVYDPMPYELDGDLYLTLNVMRHFQDPMRAYRHIWDNLPAGSMWITDFLTHAGAELLIDGEFSSVISEKAMAEFLQDKTHTEPISWLQEVGTWRLARLTK